MFLKEKSLCLSCPFCTSQVMGSPFPAKSVSYQILNIEVLFAFLVSKYISDCFIDKKSKVIRIILLIHILCSSARVFEYLCQQQGDNISGKYFLRGKTVINSSTYGGCLKPYLLVINFSLL